MSGGWQPGWKPMGMPGGGRGVPHQQGVAPRKSLVKAGAGMAYRHHQGRTDADRDVSRARWARVGDNIADVTIVAVALFFLVSGAPWWAVLIVGAVAWWVLHRVPRFAVPLRHRKLRRQAVRVWLGDSRAAGVAHGLGLVSAGHPARISSFEWEPSGDRVILLDLPAGVTVAHVDAKRTEIASALGAAYVDVSPVGFGQAKLILRQRDPLDGAERVEWAAHSKQSESVGTPPEGAWWTTANDDGQEVPADEDDR